MQPFDWLKHGQIHYCRPQWMSPDACTLHLAHSCTTQTHLLSTGTTYYNKCLEDKFHLQCTILGLWIVFSKFPTLFSAHFDMLIIPTWLLYSGKLSREKTFVNLRFCGYLQKVFSTIFLGVPSFGTAKASNPWKFSLRKSTFFTNSRKFSPLKVFRYTVLRVNQWYKQTLILSGKVIYTWVWHHPLTYPCCFHCNEVGDSGI